MNTGINFHPSQRLLRRFAEGTLPAGLNVVISAHLEHCTQCCRQVRDHENSAARDWVESSDTNLDLPRHYAGGEENVSGNGTGKMYPAPNLSHLVTDITRHPQLTFVEPADDSASEFHMLDRSVRLPRVLAKAAAEGLVWKKLSGGINQASILLDDQTQCEFLYMKPGARVPVHKHQGTEVTLVLDGSFSDEMGRYGKSDFVVRNRSHTHYPVSEEGCLCFVVLDSPLTFTSGLARLLNPFLRYRFRRVTSMT